MHLSSILNDKFWVWTKFKAFADDKCCKTGNFCLSWGRKHCGIMRKCWLPAFAPFPTTTSKGNCHCILVTTKYINLKPSHINPLPNDKILIETKLKAFADKKLNFAKMMISLFDRVENTVGKEENAGDQHFLLCLQCFPKLSSLGSLKVQIV